MSKDFPTAALPHLNAVNNCLRFALNELRALDNPSEERDSDRDTCCERLATLGLHLMKGGMPPDAEAIIREAASIPIQA